MSGLVWMLAASVFAAPVLEVSDPRTATWLAECADGDAKRCRQLGEALERHQAPPERAIGVYLTACELGLKGACEQATDLLSRADPAGDHAVLRAAMREVLAARCDDGDGGSCLILGNLEGGVRRLGWLTTGCASGWTSACQALLTDRLRTAKVSPTSVLRLSDHDGLTGASWLAFGADSASLLVGGASLGVFDVGSGQLLAPPTPMHDGTGAYERWPATTPVWGSAPTDAGPTLVHRTDRWVVWSPEAPVPMGVPAASLEIGPRKARVALRQCAQMASAPLGGELLWVYGTGKACEPERAVRWDRATGRAVGSPVKVTGAEVLALTSAGGVVTMAGSELQVRGRGAGRALSLDLPQGVPVDLLVLPGDQRALLAWRVAGRAFPLQHFVDLETGALQPLPNLQRFPGDPFGFSADGSVMAMARGPFVRVFDVATGTAALNPLPLPRMPKGQGPTAVAVSPDGSRLAVAWREVAVVYTVNAARDVVLVGGGEPWTPERAAALRSLPPGASRLTRRLLGLESELLSAAPKTMPGEVAADPADAEERDPHLIRLQVRTDTGEAVPGIAVATISPDAPTGTDASGLWAVRSKKQRVRASVYWEGQTHRSGPMAPGTDAELVLPTGVIEAPVGSVLFHEDGRRLTAPTRIEQGRARFSGLHEGDWHVVGRRADGEFGYSVVALRLGATKRVELDVLDSRPVTGRVVAAEDGWPIAWARVEAPCLEHLDALPANVPLGTCHTWTDVLGGFELEGLVGDAALVRTDADRRASRWTMVRLGERVGAAHAVAMAPGTWPAPKRWPGFVPKPRRGPTVAHAVNAELWGEDLLAGDVIASVNGIDGRWLLRPDGMLALASQRQPAELVRVRRDGEPVTLPVPPLIVEPPPERPSLPRPDRRANGTITVDPLTTLLGYVHLQVEATVSRAFSVYAGPHLRLYDALGARDVEPYTGIGVESGVRYFPNVDAPEGVWFMGRGVIAGLRTNDGLQRSTGGYGSVLAGYTLITRDELVLSLGMGGQIIDYRVGDYGVGGIFPAAHTSFGFAF